MNGWYATGRRGARVAMHKNEEECFKWHKKAADLRNVEGMAESGWQLVIGKGVEKNTAHGTALVGFKRQE